VSDGVVQTAATVERNAGAGKRKPCPNHVIVSGSRAFFRNEVLGLNARPRDNDGANRRIPHRQCKARLGKSGFNHGETEDLTIR
jgi:hypothetical protein